MTSYNRNLAITVMLLWTGIGLKLYMTAIVTDNMRGFAYSMLHIVIVGVGSFYALHQKQARG